jgi:hypothetical protein
MTEEAINEASYLVEDEAAETQRLTEEAAQVHSYQIEDDEASASEFAPIS